MRIIADTNVLLRALVGDDPVQARVAVALLAKAERVAVSLHALCELVWVLDRSYGVSRPDIAAAIRQLAGTTNIVVDRPAVEAGLALLEAGSDFADGVIAFEGRRLGGDVFMSFDRRAVAALDAVGQSARLVGPAAQRKS